MTLNRTFAQSEETKVVPENARRLAQLERDLATATMEFTLGLEAKLGPVPPLHEAINAMHAATASLDKPDVPGALPGEESALAGLIKARRNLRKFLSQKQSASTCRSIDKQQQQKVRKPPPKKDEPQLAQQIKKLAQEERSVCNGLSPKPGEGPSASSKPGEKGPSERQQEAAETAQKLQRAVRDDPALSDLARARMDTASETVQKGADSLKNDDKEKAAAQTGDAAGQLDRLADQVAGLKAKELAQKLAQARDLAQKLAKGEKDLSEKLGSGTKPGQADEQQDLAEEAKTLADWLGQLPADAADESQELSRALRQAAQANPPEELAEALKQVADTLKAGRAEPAARDAAQVAERLAALSQDLEAARRAFAQPRLDELLAAEKQAAGTQKTLKSARDAAGKAEAEKAMSDLLQAMEKLQAKEGALTPATQALREGLRTHGGWAEPKPEAGKTDDTPHLNPPTQYTQGVSRVLTALQAKIQELVLKNVLMDHDEAVPPEYKTLVEDYYRTLSEDLR